jgi:peptidoglycan/xylan/chitin deacetylase (PgdA/CDA1 family)
VGVRVGAHARTHRPLAGLGPSELEDEVGGSLEDLRARLGDPLPVLAYPNGSHDEAARAATVSAGFRAAWTTIKGRNGIGTDRWCLRRISVHANDGPIAVLWKVATGETPPWRRQ